MKKSILLTITLLFPLFLCAQTMDEINGWVAKASTAYVQNKYEDAIIYFEKIREAYDKNEQLPKDENYGDLLSLLARCYSLTGDNSKALEFAIKGMEITNATIGEKHPQYAFLLNDIAAYHSKLGNFKEAVEYGTKAVEKLKTTQGTSNPNYAKFMANLAGYYPGIKEFSKAVEYGTMALEAYNATVGPSHPAFNQLLSNLVPCFYALDDNALVVEYGKKVLEMLPESNPNYTTFSSILADSYHNLDDDTKAKEYEAKDKKVSKKTKGEKNPDNASAWSQTENILNVWGDKGTAAFQKGNYQEALQYFEKIKETLKEHNKKDEIYELTLISLARCHYFLGDFPKAVEFGEEVAEIRKATHGENYSGYAISLGDLANYYASLGDYSKSVEYGTKALDIIKAISGENDLNYATALNNLGRFYSELGDKSKAKEYTKKAIEIYEATPGERQQNYATALSSLASYYYDLGDYSKAMEYETKALETRKATLGENHPDCANSLNGLANLYSALGDYSKAMECGKKAMEILKATVGENHSNYATNLSNLANFYYNLNDFSKAIEYETKAMEIRKTILGENHPDYANSLSKLTMFCINVGQFSKGVECYKQCVSIIHSNILQQFTNLTANLRASFWKKNINVFTELYPTYAYLSPDQETVADLYDKSALFAKGLLLTTEIEMNKQILESGDKEALKMFEELQSQRLQLQKLYDTPIAERRVNTDSLAKAADKLESQLMERSKVYGDFTRKLRITWKDVQAALGKDEIAIEFLSFGILGTDSPMMAALTLKKGYKAPKYFILFKQNQMEALNDKPSQKGNQKVHFIRPEVTDLVWKPLQEELNGIHRIYFSPSGMLHSIGIEYLPGMENYDIRRLSTTREIIDMKEHPGKKKIEKMKATLYGGIDYEGNIAQATKEDKPYSTSRDISASMYQAFVDSIGLRGSSFNPLPGSLTEVENIKTSFEEKHRQVNVLTGKEATETSFRELSAHIPGILHIATHGFYYTEKEKKMMDPRRMLKKNDDHLGDAEKEDKALTRSGLLLAGANNTLRNKNSISDFNDGILTAQEISKLDLRGLDLVVLSACETGKGDVTQGEGVFGLQRGFKKAGAGTIVMSLWKVNDNATRMMMTQFYKNLCNGMEKHEALLMAQKHLREYKDEKGENIYNYPLFWAGFIILD